MPENALNPKKYIKSRALRLWTAFWRAFHIYLQPGEWVYTSLLLLLPLECQFQNLSNNSSLMIERFWKSLILKATTAPK